MKKLKAPRTSTKKFFTRVKYLENKLGPILFQLPPHWASNIERLSLFLERLPPAYRYAFEFREQTWFTDEVYELLKRHNAALCLYHMSGYDSPVEVTANFAYVRFHGSESTYGGSYSRSQLKTWAMRIEAWRDDGKELFVYFNNDPEAHAVYNARTLRELLERK